MNLDPAISKQTHRSEYLALGGINWFCIDSRASTDLQWKIGCICCYLSSVGAGDWSRIFSLGCILVCHTHLGLCI